MSCMSAFDESKIRRGQPDNAGQFAAKPNSAPAVGLRADNLPPDPYAQATDRVRESLVARRLLNEDGTFASHTTFEDIRSHVATELAPMIEKDRVGRDLRGAATAQAVAVQATRGYMSDRPIAEEVKFDGSATTWDDVKGDIADDMAGAVFEDRDRHMYIGTPATERELTEDWFAREEARSRRS